MNVLFVVSLFFFFVVAYLGGLGWCCTKKDADRQVLMDLYWSTDGDNWMDNFGWDGDLCSANGVVCDSNDFVIWVYSID